MVTVFNPERWLTSLCDSIESAVRAQINMYMDLVDSSDVVEIAFTHLGSERPTSEDLEMGDLDKILVFFNIDDIENSALGFGRGVVNEVVTPSGVDPGTIAEHLARMHMVNFDVGVVCSDAAGGSSARLQAYEMLDMIFGSPDKRAAFKGITDGVEIISYTGGRFAKDTINDVRVFRIVGTELVVRVYSREVASDAVILVDEIIQEPGLTIGGEPIVDSD